MPKVFFEQPDGELQVVNADLGQSLMEAATAAMVSGIVAECGGSCSCGTCHVYVDAGWFDRLPKPGPIEMAMLEGTFEPTPLSRLSCQVKVTEDMDGLVLRVPSRQ